MSVRQENNGLSNGENSKVEANHGKQASVPTGSFKKGISGLPALQGPDSFPKRGRISTGKEEFGVTP